MPLVGRRLGVLVLVAVASAVAAPAAASAGDLGPYERFEFSYTSKKPGTRTGFKYRVKLKQQGDEQPPTVRELKLTFAKGTKIDTGAVPACAATQDELNQQGNAACPKDSRVAGGEADVYIGSATPLTLTAAVFNTDEGIVAILTDANGNVVRTLSGKVTGGRVLVVPIPKVELSGGKEAALVRFELDIAKAGTSKRPWARTPKTCTKKGWPVVYAPLFDPIGRIKLIDVTRCRAR
jgi:hypothetical protein